MDKKIIQSIKVEETDYGKFLRISETGNIEYVTIDTEYVAITSHPTTALEQTLEGTYVYTIADFVGVGLSTSDIRTIHVEYTGRRNSRVFVSYPDDSLNATRYLANQDYSGDTDDTARNKVVIRVPINKNQTSFTIFIEAKGAETLTEIIGATQQTIY